jgi:hypothetical protein
VRSGRVELNLLHLALELGERRLGVVLRQLVDEDGTGAGCEVRSNRSEGEKGKEKEKGSVQG